MKIQDIKNNIKEAIEVSLQAVAFNYSELFRHSAIFIYFFHYYYYLFLFLCRQ